MKQAIIYDSENIPIAEFSDNIYTFYQHKEHRLVPALNEEETKQINYAVFQELIDFPQKEIDGKKIIEHLQNGHINLWFYHKFRLYFDIRNIYYDIRRIEQLAKKYDFITVHSNRSILKHYNFGEKIKIVFTPTKPKKRFSTVFNFVLVSLLRLIQGFLYNSSIKGKKLLIDKRDNYKTLLSTNGKVSYTNSYLFDLDDQFNANELVKIDLITIPKMDQNYSFSWKKIFIPDRKKRIFEESILFKGWFKKLTSADVNRTLSFYDKQLNFLSDKMTNSVQKLFVFRLIELQGSSRFYLKKYFCYLNYFKKNTPAKVIGIDEYSPNMRLIHETAKSLGAKSIGIQHGTMHELHPGYVYAQDEIKANPIPNKTIVWGERWNQFLSKQCNYPIENLSIAGQIRTDLIQTLPDNRSSDKFTVVFASQPQRDIKLRDFTAASTFQAVGELENVQLILKPHPLEVDLSNYIQLAKENNCDNYVIEANTDLYLLLKECDALITSFSTVGTETIYFNKPLIVFDPLNQDVMKYIEDGVGLKATNASDIKSLIQGLMSREIEISQQKQEYFIQQNAFKIDGEVKSRIKNQIEAT